MKPVAIAITLVQFAIYCASALGIPSTFDRRNPLTATEDVTSILNATMDAMGGPNVLRQIKTFTYHADNIYRSHTLTQNYNLISSDQSVAAAGSQNMSFEIEMNNLRSRIDRYYIYDDYWIWGFPNLQPFIDFSLVVNDGPQGFACFTKGQNSFFSSDPSEAKGYTDPYLTDYLIHQAHQFALPWLLQRFISEPNKVRTFEVHDSNTGATYQGLENDELALSVLIDMTSHLPYAIRSSENHIVYGNSTSDIVLSSWHAVTVHKSSVLLPHRFQTVYNSEIVLEDFIVDTISINEKFPFKFFDGHKGTDDSNGPPLTKTESAPAQSPDYPRSEVHEFFESGLWAGPFGFSTSDVVVNYPFPDFMRIMTVYVGYPDYVQVLVEHDNGLIITDAPPHRSKIILDWVDKHMNGKRITHVVPSHHHRDHAGGVDDYVVAGATLVVPEIVGDHYNLTGKVSRMDTYTDNEPFEFKDNSVEFRSFWKDENPHARDWSFSVATPANPSQGDNFVIFSADVINPGTDATKWDTGVARQFIHDMIDIGVPRSSLLVGSHGSSHGGTSTSERLQSLAKIAGIDYPHLSVEVWNTQG